MTGESCTVTWWGHATVEIRLDGARVVTDPLLRRRVGPLHSVGHRPLVREDDLSTVDAVLLSHLHHDHTDLPSVRRFGPTTTTVVPVGAGPLLRRHARGQVVELAVGDETRVGRVGVASTPAVHDGGRHGGHKADAVGYLVRGSRTVYFAGDTDVFPGMADLAAWSGDPAKVVDVALLPVSGWGLTLGSGHMDAAAATRAALLIRPRVVVPIHWGTLRIPVAWRLRRSHLVGVAERFADLMARAAPETRVVVPEPGVPVDVSSSSAQSRP